MTELLAIPRDWDSPPTSLDDWVAEFAALGFAAEIGRDAEGDSIEVDPLRFLGIADREGTRLVALHFELHAPDPTPAREAIEQASRALGWEVHEDDEELDE